MRPLSKLTPGRLTLVSGASGSGKTLICCDWSERALLSQEPVFWLDGDQNFLPIQLAKVTGFRDRFWGYIPSSSQHAYNLALAFLRLRVAGLIVLDSVDGLLPNRSEQQVWVKRYMPRLIGALHRSRSSFLCTTDTVSDRERSALTVYAHQHLKLGGSRRVY